jgi:hypothetical protein
MQSAHSQCRSRSEPTPLRHGAVFTFHRFVLLVNKWLTVTDAVLSSAASVQQGPNWSFLCWNMEHSEPWLCKLHHVAKTPIKTSQFRAWNHWMEASCAVRHVLSAKNVLIGEYVKWARAQATLYHSESHCVWRTRHINILSGNDVASVCVSTSDLEVHGPVITLYCNLWIYLTSSYLVVQYFRKFSYL